MSEMDKFVLQYTVEMKEAITRLEQLNSKVEGVKGETKKAGQEFGKFSKDAADEIGKLIPGVDKVSGAVKMMTAEFALAGVAVGALAIGVKSVMDLRVQYEAQRKSGMATGVSATRMEEYQRKFVKNSGGTVDRALAQDQIQALSEKHQSAYADPTRMGTEARQFRLLGVNIGERGQAKVPFNDMLTQLAGNLSKMKPEQVQGIAKAIGLSEDFAMTLAKLGPSVGKVTELTAEEVNKRQDAEKSLRTFNDEMAKFNEKMNELEMTLGQKLIPSFTQLITLINQVVDAIPKVHNKVKAEETRAAANIAGNMIMNNQSKNPLTFMNPGYAAYQYIKGRLGFGGNGIEELAKRSGEQSVATGVIDRSLDNKPAVTKPLVKSVDDMVNALDETNKEAVNNAANMSQAVNMFAGAVATFSNAIDEKQAWAAWAGEVGRAGGLALPSGSGGLDQFSRVSGGKAGGAFNAPTAYDEIFERESKRTGVPVDLLKRIASTESSFNPNAVSSVGAAGLMQILPSNNKALGVTNAFDPNQNIRAGADLMAENLKRSGGDVRTALMMYHGGLDRSNWGAKTQAYPGKVLGEGRGYGESRDSIQLATVQKNIAARLGVPLKQLQQGGINQGDVTWATSQMKAGVENQIFNINKELMTVGLPQQTRSKLLTDLRDQQSGLNMLNKYSPEVEGAAQAGGRNITIGERAIVINIAAAKDPETTARILSEHLQNSLGDIVNGSASGIKY